MRESEPRQLRLGSLTQTERRTTMDFDKIGRMIDELNANFDIVEQTVKEQEKEQLDDYKKLFWTAYEYINNFYKLFDKVALEKYNSMYIYVSENGKREHNDQYITLRYGSGYGGGEVEFGYHTFASDLYSVNLGNPNRKWFDKYFFGESRFKSEIIPFIKNFDYDYMEKQFVEELNSVITKKAEYLERRYNKAIER